MARFGEKLPGEDISEELALLDEAIAQAREKGRREKMDEWVEKAREITEKALNQAAKVCREYAEGNRNAYEEEAAEECIARIRALMEGE